jgi:carboxylesterase type B
MVVFFGGGFIQGGGSQAIPPSAYPVLNVSSKNDIIFVYPNYRVNVFGLLPGKEIAEDANSDLNPGLLDQKAVLEWVNSYIEEFGGDKGNVGIWGQSAGAGSVVYVSSFAFLLLIPSYHTVQITEYRRNPS